MKCLYLKGSAFLALVAASALLSACSSQQMYGAIQQNQKLRCQQEKLQKDYEQCMERYDTSYQEYERERKANSSGESY